MFGLSSILLKAVYSIYPRIRYPELRPDLHKRIEPRGSITCMPGEVTGEDDLFVIMWT